MIDPAQLISALASGFVPLHGKCIIELEEVPTMAGLLHIPDTARERRLYSQVTGKTASGDVACPGKVLAMTPRKNPETGELIEELFSTGDTVWVMLLMEDLNQKAICTRNERVYAILEN
jgi:co-chaperonin GroES (HSP10)